MGESEEDTAAAARGGGARSCVSDLSSTYKRPRLLTADVGRRARMAAQEIQFRDVVRSDLAAAAKRTQ